jgi:hypothetical protein
MILFSELWYVSQSTIIVFLLLWTIHQTLNPMRLKTCTGTLTIMIIYLCITILYDISMIWMKYTLGIVKIPDIPVNWFVRIPRKSWNVSKNLLTSLDILGDFVDLLRYFAMFLSIRKWLYFSCKGVGYQVCKEVSSVVGLVSTVGLGVLAALAHLYFGNDIISSIVIPRFAVILDGLVLSGVVCVILWNLNKMKKILRIKYRQSHHGSDDLYKRRFKSLFNRINQYFVIFVMMIISIYLDIISVTIISIGAMTDESSGIFNNKLVTDLLSTIHLIGSTCSQLSTLCIIIPSGHAS